MIVMKRRRDSDSSGEHERRSSPTSFVHVSIAFKHLQKIPICIQSTTRQHFQALTSPNRKSDAFRSSQNKASSSPKRHRACSRSRGIQSHAHMSRHPIILIRPVQCTHLTPFSLATHTQPSTPRKRVCIPSITPFDIYRFLSKYELDAKNATL